MGPAQLGIDKGVEYGQSKAGERGRSPHHYVAPQPGRVIVDPVDDHAVPPETAESLPKASAIGRVDFIPREPRRIEAALASLVLFIERRKRRALVSLPPIPGAYHSVLLAEEPADLSHQILRVVALHGVAGPRHRDELPIGQALCQADSVFLMEHVALAAAHDQRRASDPCEAVGEGGALGAVRILVEPLKPAPVVFPFPAAVRLLPQIVHEAPAQDRRVAPRVEFERPLDDRLDRDQVLGVVYEIADAARSRAAHFGPGVDDYQGVEA